MVKNVAETGWAIPPGEQEARGVRERMRVFVTDGRGLVDTQRAGDVSEEDAEIEQADDGEGVELERLLPSGDGEASSNVQDGKTLNVDRGRPDLRALVNETFAGTGEKEKVAVIVCGPKQLAKEIRREVGRWIEKRDVWFWSEEFGL